MAACLVVMALSGLARPQAAGQQQPSNQPPAADQQSSPSQEQTAEQKNKRKAEKPYALIFGTAYGPDDRPLYGVKITIRPQTKKHPSWEMVSDHRGEFAQRVPPGPGDYLVRGDAKFAPAGPDGKPQLSKTKRLKGETKIHVENEERLDISVHLTE
ncbi:MAG TPA: hypothetical protein VH724_19890 [Candidatus Angelobacter sp.]|nr:hypothetical protein [Candidatus Angelobacter sp.]